MSKATTLTAPTAGAGTARLLSDDRLTRRATKGDRRAFAAIYRRYHRDLYRYCAAILGNPQDAQDALQNTMVKVLRALPGEERRIKLKPWLYRIAHNESIELLRSRRPTEPIDPELVLGGSEPFERTELRERLARLIRDLEDLPERQRSALVMRELAGLSFEQIGAAFETSPAVARQTVYEARLGLQRMGEGREMSCEEVMRALSDGDRRVTRRRDLRAHLRSCSGCREFRGDIAERRRDFAVLAPLPAAASSGLLQGILSGGHGGVGGGAIGAVGASAGKTLATSTVLKFAATVAIVAAVGVSAADRGRLIHIGLFGGHDETTKTAGLTSSSKAVSRPSEGATRRSGVGHIPVRRHLGSPGPSALRKHPRATAAHAASGTTAQSPSQFSLPRGHSHGHGPPYGSPQASNHGQQTAASHGPANLPAQAQGHSGHPTHPANHHAVPSQSPAHGRSAGKAKPPTHPAHPVKPTTPRRRASSHPSAGLGKTGNGHGH